MRKGTSTAPSPVSTTSLCSPAGVSSEMPTIATHLSSCFTTATRLPSIVAIGGVCAAGNGTSATPPGTRLSRGRDAALAIATSAQDSTENKPARAIIRFIELNTSLIRVVAVIEQRQLPILAGRNGFDAGLDLTFREPRTNPLPCCDRRTRRHDVTVVVCNDRIPAIERCKRADCVQHAGGDTQPLFEPV